MPFSSYDRYLPTSVKFVITRQIIMELNVLHYLQDVNGS
jgi:hypothetical protein